MRFSGMLSEWIDSWGLLWRKKWVVPLSGIFDIAFLVAFGLFTGPVFDALARHAIIIGSLVSHGLRNPAGNVFEGPAGHYVLQFFCLLAVLGIVVFAVYCIFQGLAWHVARTAAGRKESWRFFLLQFARINIIWFVLFAAWWVVAVLLDLRRIFVEKISGQPAGIAVSAWLAVLLVLFYFAIISYDVMGLRPGFVLGFRKAFILVPAVLLAMIPAFIVARFVSGRLLVLVPAAMIFLVLCAFARVFVLRIVARVSRRGF
jgi:hypothetical protein